MSSPHVSGAAALLLAQNPNLNCTAVEESSFCSNGDVPSALVDKNHDRSVVSNVFNSLQALAENDTTAQVRLLICT